ncbi:hypothetical protein [Streptomyces formicae]|uniref:Secreted protein n=1 Tax=Streptomyces formicae TaxID=1616117 RepID=A0ABY3WIF9_9ACTN|nr:hypothetical protein [Streptomyces formicae]UNM12379.1 hypothetical protein J4032_13265 [Streptomyces formicae]
MRTSRRVALSATAALTLVTLGGVGTQSAAAATNPPTAAAAPGTCDTLKRVLNGYKNASNPNIYGATAYITAYIAAKAQNCAFLGSGNPYHVTDSKPAPGPHERNAFGANFKLQTGSDSTHKCSILTSGSGVFIEVDDDGRLRGRGDAGCSGDSNPENTLVKNTQYAYQALHEKQDNGSIVNQRVILDNGSLRELYRLVIMTGPHTGKCVGVDDPDADSITLHAVSCETNKTYFAPQSGAPKSGGDVIDALWIEDGLQNTGGIFTLSAMSQWYDMRHLGVIDLSGKERAGDAMLYKQNDDWNQKFFYRPPA